MLQRAVFLDGDHHLAAARRSRASRLRLSRRRLGTHHRQLCSLVIRRRRSIQCSSLQAPASRIKLILAPHLDRMERVRYFDTSRVW